MHKWFEAAHALALQAQVQFALDQQAALKLLDLQFIHNRIGERDHLIPRLNVQFGGRQFALQPETVRRQVAQIDR